MPLVRDNSLRSTAWMLMVVLLVSWGGGALAGLRQDQMLMGEGSHSVKDDDRHCHMPKAKVFQHDCGSGCLNLQQTLPQRDSAFLDFERTDQPVLVSMDLADLLPVRGPPRNEILFFSTAPPVPTPPRLSFCCLRI